MILYVGPDQVIPLSGILGTVVGLALMFWSRILGAIRKVAGFFSPKNTEKL
jgi:hypothetical protein